MRGCGRRLRRGRRLIAAAAACAAVGRARVAGQAAEVVADGSLRLEYAGLARGEDPRLDDAVASIADRHIAQLTGRSTGSADQQTT